MRSLTEKKFLTDKEREHLVSYCERHKGERDPIMFRLTLFSGGRCSEILALKVSDFDFGQHHVTLRGLKGSEDRTIPLSKPFSIEIKEFCDTLKLKGDDRLFPISTARFRQIWYDVRPNPNKSGHSLRHTAGTLLYINCRDIYTVKSFLGHRQIQNTIIYMNYVEGPRKLRSAMRGMWGQRIVDEVG
jgi:integrase